jgi:hypothetical protein
MTSEERLSQPLTNELKIRFANLVKENKDILFGRVTPTLRNIDKYTKWKAIYDELVSHGAVIKDPAYLRDRMWDNLKRGATEKKKKFNRTGGAGGVRYTEYERVTLEILDPESAYMAGIGQRVRQPVFPGVDGISQSDVNEDSILNTTSQSIFDSTLTAFQGPSNETPMFATPRPITTRTSSPVRLEVGDAGTATGSAPPTKKHKRGHLTNLWASETYKELKVKEIEKNLEEQELRMQLMRMQVEESRLRGEAEKERAEFFRKAGLAVENAYDLQINREYNVRL